MIHSDTEIIFDAMHEKDEHNKGANERPEKMNDISEKHKEEQLLKGLTKELQGKVREKSKERR